MSQSPTPRGPLGQLLEDAKKDQDGLEWRDVEQGSGIPVTSIQSWVSGRTKEPPLRGLLHLARYLGIPAQAVMDRALDGYTPPRRLSDESAASGQADPAKSGHRVADGIAYLDGKRAAGKPRSRRSRPDRPQA